MTTTQQQIEEMVEQGRFKDIPPNRRTVRLHRWMFNNGYIDLEMDRKTANRYISLMCDKPIRTTLTPKLVEFMIEMDCKFYHNLKQYGTDRYYKIVGVDRYIQALLRYHPHVGIHKVPSEYITKDVIRQTIDSGCSIRYYKQYLTQDDIQYACECNISNYDDCTEEEKKKLDMGKLLIAQPRLMKDCVCYHDLTYEQCINVIKVHPDMYDYIPLKIRTSHIDVALLCGMSVWNDGFTRQMMVEYPEMVSILCVD
jgi:hypothetical protein